MEFTLTTQIPASVREIYNAWLTSQGHTKMTGGKAEVSDIEGGEFQAWDGYITGKNIKLEPYTRIVQSWRTTEFADDERDSRLEIILEEKDGITELTLHHTDVPEVGEQYITGWEEHYFKPMKDYFGH